jgi:hypothetical protein
VSAGAALQGLPVPEQDGSSMTGDPADPLEVIRSGRACPWRYTQVHEPLRAWAWHVVGWAAVAVAIAALVLGGVLAVQQLGPAMGIAATLVGAVLALGTLTWLASGKARP